MQVKQDRGYMKVSDLGHRRVSVSLVSVLSGVISQNIIWAFYRDKLNCHISPYVKESKTV